MQTAPRILVVDDHPAVRRGLVLVLEAEGFVPCGEAGERAEALRVAGIERPDVALVGLSMHEEETIALVAELHEREIAVLVCSEEEAPAHVKRALAAGARAYVSKADAPSAIVRAVRDVLAGWVLVSPSAAENLGPSAGPAAASGEGARPIERRSPREPAGPVEGADERTRPRKAATSEARSPGEPGPGRRKASLGKATVKDLEVEAGTQAGVQGGGGLLTRLTWCSSCR